MGERSDTPPSIKKRRRSSTYHRRSTNTRCLQFANCIGLTGFSNIRDVYTSLSSTMTAGEKRLHMAQLCIDQTLRQMSQRDYSEDGSGVVSAVRSCRDQLVAVLIDSPAFLRVMKKASMSVVTPAEPALGVPQETEEQHFYREWIERAKLEKTKWIRMRNKRKKYDLHNAEQLLAEANAGRLYSNVTQADLPEADHKFLYEDRPNYTDILKKMEAQRVEIMCMKTQRKEAESSVRTLSALARACLAQHISILGEEGNSGKLASQILSRNRS